MKELLLKIWDEQVQIFGDHYGSDSQGDIYIAELRERIAEFSWRKDTTISELGIRMDSFERREEDVQRFINVRLCWEFRQAAAQVLKDPVCLSLKQADRGYSWYKDYGD